MESEAPGVNRALAVVLQPVEDMDTFEPAPNGERGDFVIQTEASRTLEEIECRRLLAQMAESQEGEG